MLSTTTLTVVLVVACLASIASGILTVRALIDTRRDLGYVMDRGIGNGRRAAAEGEHLLAWARLGQAGVWLALTGILAYIAVVRVGLTAQVAVVWVVVVALVGLGAGGVCWQAVTASRTRRRVLHLGIVDDLQADSERLTGVVDNLHEDEQRLSRRLDDEL